MILKLRKLQNLAPNLDLKVPNNLLSQTPENGDEMLSAISKYQNYPRLDTNTASHSSDIPTKILKRNIYFFSPFILSYVDKSISLSTFPSILKLADSTPVYKTDSRYEKSNYRPISILPNLSKIYGEYAPLLIDLSKAFSCLPHNLIITK